MDNLTPKQRQQRLYLTLTQARKQAEQLRKCSESQTVQSETQFLSSKKRTLQEV